MPGFVVNTDATIACDHKGIAQPRSASRRVKVNGGAVITKAHSYDILSCTRLTPSPPGPCKTGSWVIKLARKVRVEGSQVVLEDSLAECLPPKGGLKIESIQRRVKGI